MGFDPASEAFAPAPQTAPANLRRSKALMISASLEAGGEARANQSAVWDEIEQRADRLQADAPTRALQTSTRVAATSSTDSRRRSSFAMASPVRWSRSAAASPCSTG